MKNQRKAFQTLSPLTNAILKAMGVTALSLTLLSGCSNDQQNAETSETATYHTIRASSMFSQGEIGSALKEVQLALSKEPTNLNAIKLAGDLFLSAGDSETALSYFQQALKSAPDNVEYQLSLVEALIKQKQYHTAKLQSEEAIKQIPSLAESADLNALKGYIEMGTGDRVQANLLLNKALATDENNARALIGLAKINVQEGNFKKATAFTEQARKAHPFALEVSLWAGQLSLMQEQFSQAEKQFSEALLTLSKQDIMSADRYYALNGMVSSLVAQGRTEEALRFSEMIENSPQGQLITNYNSAMDSLKDGNIDEAEETFNTILSKMPGHVNSETAVGAIKLRKGDLAAAEEHLLTAVESGKSADRAYKLLALTQLRMGKPNDVITLLDKALQKSENDPELLSLMGISYFKLDDIPLASQYLERAIKQDPKHTASRLAVAGIHERNNEFAKASDLYQAIIADNPKLGTTYRRLFGSLLKTSDNYDQALSEFEALTSNYKAHLAPHLVLAMAYFEQGQFEKAFSTAENAQKRFPKSKEVQGTLAALHFSKARSLLKEPNLDDSTIREVEKALSHAKALAPDHLMIAGLEIQLFLAEDKTEQALKKALEIQSNYPSNIFGYTAEGQIHLMAGQLDSAVKAYEQAWSIQPSTQLGIKLFDLKRKTETPTEALVTHLESWQSAEPDNHQASLALAMALQTINATDKAIIFYEKVLELEPKNALALNNLAWLRHEKGAPNAVEIAERAYEVAPKNPSVIDTYGWLLFKSQQITAAIERLEEAHGLAPEQLEIMQHLRDALKANNQMEEASVIQAKIDDIQKNQG